MGEKRFDSRIAHSVKLVFKLPDNTKSAQTYKVWGSVCPRYPGNIFEKSICQHNPADIEDHPNKKYRNGKWQSHRMKDGWWVLNSVEHKIKAKLLINEV